MMSIRLCLPTLLRNYFFRLKSPVSIQPEINHQFYHAYHCNSFQKNEAEEKHEFYRLTPLCGTPGKGVCPAPFP